MQRKKLPAIISRQLVISPLPRNMHPQRDKERRQARARALTETYENDRTAMYVDVAQMPERPQHFVAVVIRAADGNTVNACSLQATNAEQAEEAAIALALCGGDEARTVLSDSQMAITNYSRGKVGMVAARILPKHKETTTHIRWFPAHVGPIAGGVANRNEKADAVARELARRAAPHRLASQIAVESAPDMEPILNYSEVLAWHRVERAQLPPPHPRLNRREGVLLRQLQTRTVLTPALARHMCPELYGEVLCSVCADEPATLAHIMWGCGASDYSAVSDPLPPDMVDYVSSSNPKEQLIAVQRLEDALAQQARTGDPPSPSGRKRARQVAKAGALA